MTPATQFETVPLARIARLSPLNPRQDMESDVSGLAAMIRARGQQYPIKLRAIPDDPEHYEVLDGGRRWRALREIAREGDMRDAIAIIEQGDEIAAREIALMVSVSPKPLHPVEEYEAFAQLAADGASIEAIAAHFGESERHVRQRLALGNLSPRVRAKWRDGAIDRDQAIAFTAGPVEAQDALLDKLEGQPRYTWNEYNIRRKLRGETLSNSGPEGKFLLADKARVEAYVAAGGRIEENIFEDEIVIRDPAIANRIVEAALRAEAARIKAEEGWGAALIDGEQDYDSDGPEPEFTDSEEARLEAIAAENRDADPATPRALEEERAAIWREALLRHIPREERECLAVLVGLDSAGLYFLRGLAIPEPETESADEGENDPENHHPEEPRSGVSKDEDEYGDARDEQATRDPLAEPGKALRAVIDEAATEGLRAVTRRRGDIGLMLAVAALGCMYGASVVRLSGRLGDDTENALVAELTGGASFEEALDICARATTGDLSVALFRLIAASIDTRESQAETIGVICNAVRARAGDLAGAFDAALDRRAFFEAAPKVVTLGCVTGLIGEAEAGRVKKMKKAELADYVARLSKDKGHLPAPFANWANGPEVPDAGQDAIHIDGETTLAQAMDQAITADEAKPAATKKARSRKAKADAK